MKTIFINRQKEIDTVRQLLASRKNRALILLGDGGIGKTRFLQQVRYIAENDYKKEGVRTLLWWDFDEYIQKDRPETYIKNKFIDAAGLFEQVPDPYSISFEEISQRINKNPKRNLLLFDTLEKLSDPRITSGLFELFSNLENSVFVFAGRPPLDEKGKSEFENFIRRVREIDPSLKKLTIGAFDFKSALVYISFKARMRRVFISNKDKEKLAELSRGVPILLDLATDYLANNISIPSFLAIISDFDFELHLVDSVSKLKSPLDLAVLILSVVHPLHSSSLAVMMNVKNPKDIETLFQKLKGLSFIKVLPDGQIILHDKMEELILTHIWGNIHLRPSVEFQQQIFRKAFEFFKKREQELVIERRYLKNRPKAKNISAREIAFLNRELDMVTTLREVATQKWVRFGLVVNTQSMWQDYLKLIQDLRTGNKYEFIQKLVDEVNKPLLPNQEPYWKKLNSTQLYDFQFISARSEKDTGNLDGAITDFEKLLVKYGKNKDKRVQILNLLASTQTQTGISDHLHEAIKNHMEVLRYVQSKYSKSHEPRYLLDVARIENQIGYTHRLLEDDEPNAYKNAVEHYQQGRGAALEFKEHLENQLKRKRNYESKLLITRDITIVEKTIASINNGLGYAQGLQGSYDEAYYHLENAISIWEQTGDTREIARAKTSLGILKRDQGNFDEAALLFAEALELPHSKDDQLNLCRIYHHKGWNEWELGAKAGFETEEGLKFLEKAYSSLDSSLRSIGADSKYVREMSGIYHNLSEIVWRLGQVYKKRGQQKIGRELMTKARENIKKAIMLSKEVKNRRYLIDSLVSEAQYDLEEKKLEKIDLYFHEVMAFEKKYPQFGLLYGTMYRIMGDVFCFKKEHDRARKMYGKAFPLIFSAKSGAGLFGFVEEQRLFQQRMNKVNPNIAKKYYEYFLRIWSKEDKNKQLVSWIDNEIYKMIMTMKH